MLLILYMKYSCLTLKWFTVNKRLYSVVGEQGRKAGWNCLVWLLVSERSFYVEDDIIYRGEGLNVNG